MLSGFLKVQYSKKIRSTLYTSSSPTTTTTTTKTEQENEALAHSFCTEIFQKANFSLADEILTPDFILRNPVLLSFRVKPWLRRCKEICITSSR